MSVNDCKYMQSKSDTTNFAHGRAVLLLNWF